MSTSTACFNHVTTFRYLSQATRILYQTWWGTFDRIQAYNLNVSTQRALAGPGAVDPKYYVYKSNEERIEFTNGRMLHIQAYPTLNWNPVPTSG